MAYEIFDCSPEAAKRIESETDAFGVTERKGNHRTKYPFADLLLGKCFTVPIGEANEASLRNQASASGVRFGGKKFAVIKHVELGVVEVARIL